MKIVAQFKTRHYFYFMITNTSYTDGQIFKAIDSLLQVSGRGHLVSVVDESNKFCFKTFTGEIGTIDKSFIYDRCHGQSQMSGKNTAKLPKF